MGQTVQGGIYKDAVGDGYHDAHGNKVANMSEAAKEKAIEKAAEPEKPAKEKKARKPRKAKA